MGTRVSNSFTRILLYPSNSKVACKNFSTRTNTKTFSHLFQECSAQRALCPGKQAHAHMITCGFQPTIFVTNCLIQFYIRCSCFGYAYQVFAQMPQPDTVSWNSMIFAHARCGNMTLAQSLFDSMPHRDVVTWNSLISGYLQKGDHFESIRVFIEMRENGLIADSTTLAVVLKATAFLENHRLGSQIHCLALRLGFDTDVVSGSALLDMYAKCNKLSDSLRFFNEMPQKNWVSWSAVIAGCVQNDQPIRGLQLFIDMQRVHAGVSQSTYASVLRSCACLSSSKLGSQLHSHTIKSGFGLDVIVGTATLDMYVKCNNLRDAHRVFNSLPDRSVQCYNAIITGYARNYQGFEALQLFRSLHKNGIGADEITLSGAFSACATIKGNIEGTQLHGLAVKLNLIANTCVTNAILDMYGKCGDLTKAFCVFDEMAERDEVSWNAIIAAHEQNGIEEDTLVLFVSMLFARIEPDEFTYGSVLKACAGQQALNYGTEIHSRIIKSGMGLNLFVGCALVEMYSKCGMMEEAEKLHYRLEAKQTTVSWNAIISGFSLHNQSEDAQKFFSQMLESGVQPDNFTYATILDTCANLATIGLGKQLHAQIIKQKMQSDVYISSTLVDLYSKCGNMQDSRLMFDKTVKRDFVTWNAMICGYSQHGIGEEALEIFERMQLESVNPNHATFIAVLRACGHIGLVEKGFHYFHSMSRDYGLQPQLEHYSCMVDIMGRSGKVEEALDLINEMPCKADAVIWRTLLSICKTQGNVEVAEKAASRILELEPEDASAYILLSNIYADAGMWGEVSKMRRMMRRNMLKKEPGCSWIEVKEAVHAFLVWDKTHPRSNEIYEKLDILIADMKWLGYVPEIDLITDEDAERTDSSC